MACSVLFASFVVALMANGATCVLWTVLTGRHHGLGAIGLFFAWFVVLVIASVFDIARCLGGHADDN